MATAQDFPSGLEVVRMRAERLQRAEEDVTRARNELYAALREARKQDNSPSYSALAMASGLTKARIQQILTGTRRGHR
jgi:hypothetical protein